jgi:hypothetical protein
MEEPAAESEGPKARILATIANTKDPIQRVEIVHLPDKQLFVTRGISQNFRLQEIAIPQSQMLAEIQVVTRLLSHVLERIVTAAELGLPFQYDYDFEFGGRRYRLEKRDDYLLLLEKD